MKKILLIEDDKKIRRFLDIELTNAGYFLETAENGDVGIKKAQTSQFDLILLDLSLPDISGEEICKTVKTFLDTPIIIVSAKDQSLTKVKLLDYGATDYVTKPFVIEELLARIRVVFRNSNSNTTGNNINLCYYNLKIDPTQMKFFIDNTHVQLTKTEYNLIHYFILNKELLLTREQIISNVWGFDYLGDDKIVDAYVKIIRKKIPNNFLQTVRGFGYILKKN